MQAYMSSVFSNWANLPSRGRYCPLKYVEFPHALFQISKQVMVRYNARYSASALAPKCYGLPGWYMAHIARHLHCDKSPIADFLPPKCLLLLESFRLFNMGPANLQYVKEYHMLLPSLATEPRSGA